VSPPSCGPRTKVTPKVLVVAAKGSDSRKVSRSASAIWNGPSETGSDSGNSLPSTEATFTPEPAATTTEASGDVTPSRFASAKANPRLAVWQKAVGSPESRPAVVLRPSSPPAPRARRGPRAALPEAGGSPGGAALTDPDGAPAKEKSPKPLDGGSPGKRSPVPKLRFYETEAAADGSRVMLVPTEARSGSAPPRRVQREEADVKDASSHMVVQARLQDLQVKLEAALSKNEALEEEVRRLTTAPTLATSTSHLSKPVNHQGRLHGPAHVAPRHQEPEGYAWLRAGPHRGWPPGQVRCAQLPRACSMTSFAFAPPRQQFVHQEPRW